MNVAVQVTADAAGVQEKHCCQGARPSDRRDLSQEGHEPAVRLRGAGQAQRDQGLPGSGHLHGNSVDHFIISSLFLDVL